jgi:hypothetical protein
LWDMVDDIQLQPHVPDRFIWKWTANGEYTASSAYQAFFVGMTLLVGAMDVWRASVPPKVKFLAGVTRSPVDSGVPAMPRAAAGRSLRPL